MSDRLLLFPFQMKQPLFLRMMSAKIVICAWTMFGFSNVLVTPPHLAVTLIMWWMTQRVSESGAAGGRCVALGWVMTVMRMWGPLGAPGAFRALCERD